MRSFQILFCWLSCAAAIAETPSYSWELGPTGSKASFRGIHAVSDDVVWICGSDSTVLLSSDGGSRWVDVSPQFGDLQFRSVHAWNADEACIASAGTPAIILQTKDGGETWQEVFRHSSEKAFFDGLAFWDENRGVAFSDPVAGTLLVVETSDGGKTWDELKELPSTRAGEAGFAASDSSMIVGPNGAIWIGTGGGESPDSRVHYRSAWAKPWNVVSVPIPSRSEQGIFSLALLGEANKMVAVGGDYRPDTQSPLTAVVSEDSGVTWLPAANPPPAFRSAVLHSESHGWIATGPSGSDYSEDGSHWTNFTDTGFHALAKSKSKVFATGSDGRFAVLKLSDR